MGEKVSKLKKGVKSNLVRVIDLDESTKVSAQDVIDLLQMLVQGNKSVTVFHVSSGNALTNDAAKQISALLSSFSTRDTQTREAGSLSVAFKQAEFNTSSISLVLSSLKSCDIIGEFVLHGNYQPFDEGNIQTLEKVLLDSDSKCSLKKLDLGCFATSKKITSMLAQVLARQRKLTHLALSKWELRTDDIKTLMNGCTIEYLDLPECEISDEALRAFSDSLASNTTLRKLTLDGNNITDKGLDYLFKALETNTTCPLASVSLERNEIENTAKVAELNAALAKRVAEMGKPIVKPDAGKGHSTSDVKEKLAAAIFHKDQAPKAEFLDYM